MEKATAIIRIKPSIKKRILKHAEKLSRDFDMEISIGDALADLLREREK